MILPTKRTRESNSDTKGIEPHLTFILDRLAWTLFYAYIPPLSWGEGFLQFSVALHTKMTCAQAINNTITCPKLCFVVYRVDLHSPYCRYLRHPFMVSHKYSTLLTVILPTSWLSIPILMDWQLISDIISHFHNHAYLLAPLGEELFPLGFAPDISHNTNASMLRCSLD